MTTTAGVGPVDLLGLFHAGPTLFRSGWFVESLATQTLVIFAVRTPRVPFVRSRPSPALLAAALGIAVIGAVLPYTPLADPLGFTGLPGRFFAVLVGMVVAYLLLIEVGKRLFYAEPEAEPARERRRGRRHRLERRASRFSHTQTG